MKITLIINWKETGKWAFLRFLKSRYAHVEVLQPVWGKSETAFRLSSLTSELYLPIVALFRHHAREVIISWQMRIGVCYGILSRIIRRAKRPVHIIQDFHIDLTGTRKHYRFRLFLLQLAIPGIDYFCCTSTEEEAIYSRMFHIPRERVLFLPLAQALPSSDSQGFCSKDYIFSFGNSDRDFDTLIRAVADMNIPLVILSQRYQPSFPLPQQVRLLREFIPESELIRWIAESRMVVIPLFDYRVSAGQVSLLLAMSLKRPVIVSRNMATIEYAVHDVTARFYDPGDVSDLQDQIDYLWNNRFQAEEIAARAQMANRHIEKLRNDRFSWLLQQCKARFSENRSA
jgi:glycosyltransferase involved in cell wall biosynthesis